MREELAGKDFSGKIIRDWQIASFSSLTFRLRERVDFFSHASMDLPDHDQTILPEAPVLEEEPFSIFAFPRGAKAGSLLHEVFEGLDFMEKDQAVIKKLVESKLRGYGFDEEWGETVEKMVGRVLAAPLKPGTNGLTLSRIGMKDRLTELEFYLPLQPITPKKLKKVFSDYGGAAMPSRFPGRVEELDFSPARGFMKGFIDLVVQSQGRFYIIDWKSNFLGNRIEEYNLERMAREMEESFYLLQSNLYVLALHQYLKKRVPDYRYREHFGGVFYIFLRGVDPKAGDEFGIYRDLPVEELVEALSRNLIDTMGK